MEKSEATRLLAMITGAWPRPPLAESTTEVYAMALADLDYELAKAAVMRLVQTAKWLPTVSEIREAAVKGRVSLPSPEEAWGIVRRAISRVGNYRSPVFDCVEIQQAAGDIGWQALCQADEGDASNRARFCAAYAARVSRRMEAEATGRPPRLSARPLASLHGQVLHVETGYATERPFELEGESPQRGGGFKQLMESYGYGRDEDEQESA